MSMRARKANNFRPHSFHPDVLFVRWKAHSTTGEGNVATQLRDPDELSILRCTKVRGYGPVADFLMRRSAVVARISSASRSRLASRVRSISRSPHRPYRNRDRHQDRHADQRAASGPVQSCCHVVSVAFALGVFVPCVLSTEVPPLGTLKATERTFGTTNNCSATFFPTSHQRFGRRARRPTSRLRRAAVCGPLNIISADSANGPAMPSQRSSARSSSVTRCVTSGWRSARARDRAMCPAVARCFSTREVQQ